MTIVAWLRGGVIELIRVRSRADVAAFVYIFFFTLGSTGKSRKDGFQGYSWKMSICKQRILNRSWQEKELKKKTRLNLPPFWPARFVFQFLSRFLFFFFFFFFLKRKITSFGRRNWRIFEKLIKSLQVFRFLLD